MKRKSIALEWYNTGFDGTNCSWLTRFFTKNLNMRKMMKDLDHQ